MRASIVFFSALFVLAISSSAFALSIDHDSGVNSDGSAKFADPDEQMPGFMTPPPSVSPPSQGAPSTVLPLSSGSGGGIPAMSLSVNHFNGSQQPDAFDQAYSRK